MEAQLRSVPRNSRWPLGSWLKPVIAAAQIGRLASIVQPLVSVAVPLALVSLTMKACSPAVRPKIWRGEEHEVKAPSSSWQVYVPTWVPENVKVATGEFVVPLGPSVIVTTGATTTVHERAAAVSSVFPATSVARTRNVCTPSDRSASSWGLVHAVNAEPSKLQAKVELGSSDSKLSDAVVAVVGDAGPAVMVVAGAVTSSHGPRTIVPWTTR